MLSLVVGAMLAVEPSDPADWPREFRGAWVATVDNIDWPSKPGLPAAQAKAELVKLFDGLQNVGINAVVFQVRPMCDALYVSDLEPSSWFLTGRSGAPLEFDPLEEAVRLAHERGMELHAWCNPFRARHPAMKDNVSNAHVARSKPGLVRKYGKQLWLDPGSAEAREATLKVFEDIVRRYDIDGFHIDDYFYPYPIYESGKKVRFDDDRTFANAGTGDRLAWRRANVDGFVESMYTRLKKVKPWVKVGVSPFGILRPGVPQGIQAGLDQVADLGADPVRWSREGWVDYLVPQLYWKCDSKGQPFEKLMEWWANETVQPHQLYAGLFTSQTNNGWPAAEIRQQILIARGKGQGQVHFSAKALLNDWGGVGRTVKSLYSTVTLAPSVAKEARPVSRPEFFRSQATAEGRKIEWTAVEGARFYAWSESSAGTLIRNGVSTETEATVSSESVLVVRAVDRYGNLSKPLTVLAPSPTPRGDGR
ncbi:MAG: family 10 glycosylhydrolase [Fimbriimonadaceae bacterium]|nr:family 10 glycosylhydrolase [Fimbriimonadaceae bacterium]QYK55069.1 MAG: family 10 glycosylhydrolase [Fimbriimonadaceae bacterium]